MARRALGGAPSQARFVALIALLLPWSTTGLIFALIPWLIAFAFVDLRANFHAGSMCSASVSLAA